MTDHVNGAAPEQQQAHFALTADLQMVKLVFPTHEGRRELEMPSTQLPAYLEALTSLVDHLRANGIVPPARQPGRAVLVQGFVAGEPTMRGAEKHTAIRINPGLSEDVIYLMPDLMALKLADGIEQKVFNGLSLDEQKAMIEKISEKPKLILPGGRRH